MGPKPRKAPMTRTSLMSSFTSTERLPFTRGRFLRELAIVLLAVTAYFLVRGATEGSRDTAIANAYHVIDFERALGLYWEPELQDFVVDKQWLVTALNWVYVWGHWPVIATIGVWLFLRRPAAYYLIRNAFLVSGAIGLVVFVIFPVAPPRLAGIDILDTVTAYSHSYRVLQPPAFVNQYAAMPSLHFGWNLLVGLALVLCTGSVMARVFAVAFTTAMLLAVVLTANHFIIDAVAGSAVALFGLAVASWLPSAPLPQWLHRDLFGGVP
jgi:hypothetical protein